MTRITPRTCLWPLTISLFVTFALSIGLTYQSNNHCYAATCAETNLPLQTRLHVVIWYLWLSITVAVLAVRAFHLNVQKFVKQPTFSRQIPILGKQLAISGVIMVLWILALYGTIVGVWWTGLRDYFVERGIQGYLIGGNKKLAAIALTGHMCDVTMGMVLIPISRHSALRSFFKIAVSTSLAFHMLVAYLLFALVIIHASLYVSWVAFFNTLTIRLKMVFPVLNPTYTYEEVWPGLATSLGSWRLSLIFSGAVTAFIMLLVLITTLPKFRVIFYFTHLLTIVAVVVICLHGSTMFYCTAPGLMMWALDWGMRIYELKARISGRVSTLGKGWYV
jgi:hypothetical protein